MYTSSYSPSPLRNSTTNTPILRNSASQAQSQKIAVLQKEFEEIDADRNGWVSKQELFTYLDKRTGTQFDRDIAIEMFERMDQDHNNQISISEFIRVYIEAEDMLIKKIDAANRNIKSYKRQQEEALSRAKEERAREKLNNFGIDENSTVLITIIEALDTRGADYGPGFNLYVEVLLDDKKMMKTKIAAPGLSPLWDEKMSFDVFDPKSYLKFTVYNQGQREDRVAVGEVLVTLEEVKDQNMHDVVLDLYDERGLRKIEKLHVKIQWIHSKVKYFNMVAEKWEQNYKLELEELQDYQKFLDTLYQPFPGLRVMHQVRTSAQPAKEVSMVANLKEFDSQVLKMMNMAALAITNDQQPTPGFWTNLTLIFCLVELIMAILISFKRPCFFDFIYPIFIYMIVKHGPFDKKISLRKIAYAIIISIVLFDIVFLGLYSGKWTSQNTKDAFADWGTRKLVLFLTFINLFIKAILAMLSYVLAILNKKPKSKKARPTDSTQRPSEKSPGKKVRFIDEV